MRQLVSFLFARPSFLEGAARVLDLGGTLQEYNTSESGLEADLRALASDWRAVGDEIATATERVERETVAA